MSAATAREVVERVFAHADKVPARPSMCPYQPNGCRASYPCDRCLTDAIAQALDAAVAEERARIDLEDVIDLIDALAWNVPRRKGSEGLHKRAADTLAALRATAASR